MYLQLGLRIIQSHKLSQILPLAPVSDPIFCLIGLRSHWLKAVPFIYFSFKPDLICSLTPLKINVKTY